MTKRAWLLTSGCIVAALLYATGDRDGPSAGEKKPAGADEKALIAQARDFAALFAKQDAKAIASLWTEQGEMHDDGGGVAKGRADIEQAFAALFKEKPKARIEVLVDSIRFPAKDLAVEEGILRLSPADNELP